MRKNKAILVTGSHRSGSTWAGKVLSYAQNTTYIHEPFNIDISHGLVNSPLKYWYEYIGDENASQYKASIDQLLKLKGPTFKEHFKGFNPKLAAKIYRDKMRAFLCWQDKNTPIVKDPLAYFSASWLSTTYDMNVLLLIRHPAAFCASLQLKSWHFDFTHFLKQPFLLKRYLSKYKNDIEDFAHTEHSIIDQAILLWNCIYHCALTYQSEHPSWLFVKHEDLSISPIKEFEKIYHAFGLEFSDTVKEKIQQSSGPENPTEQQADNEFVRNSKANIHNWKTRLKKEEIDYIKSKTKDVSQHFYNEEHW